MTLSANALLAEAAALEANADALYESAHALRRLAKTIRTSGDGIDYVDPLTGKMTEAGVREINQMFIKGHRVSDIARHFGITQSAVSYRHKMWQQDQRRRSARGK